MKDVLDLIILKKSNYSRYVTKIDQETIEKVREDIKNSNSINDYNALRNLNEKKSFNYIKIFRKVDEKNNNEYKVKDKNSNDSYYIYDGNFTQHSDMIGNEEEKNITNLNCDEKDENNVTILNTYEHAGIYSDYTKYRGSNRTKNCYTYIDESNGLIKEIFSTTYMNLSKQDYISQTDYDVYNEDNSIKEIDAFTDQNEQNITNQNGEINNNTKNDLNGNISLVISHHIFMNVSYLDEKAIDNIYNGYLNNFTYEENNSNLTMLNRLKRALSLNDLDKYEIIEGNNIRNL